MLQNPAAWLHARRMLFNSITFILFLAIVILFHYSPVSWSAKKTNLLIASYVFYAAWNPLFILLLLMSTLLDWKVASRIYQSDSVGERKFWMVVSLAVNLGTLAVFKYTNFLMENLASLAGITGFGFNYEEFSIVLPMGISFYTFQTISYSIDVYREQMKPWNSLRDYALYVSFFPQLVAGPIVRSWEFLPQTLEPKRFDFSGFSIGMSLLIIGLMEKVFLADSVFGPLVDTVYASEQAPDAFSAWAAGTSFTMQIFCDFAGYSLCAIGIALSLGFRLPFNFNSPFAAVGFSDFWRRWHMSLSSWLRDYLYISLGGNRFGRSKTLRNLIFTMVLGGLWHGAAWTFVIWGLCHGVLLITERLLRVNVGHPLFHPGRVQKFIYRVLTLVCVILCFTIFRAENFGQAVTLLGAMISLGQDGAAILAWNLQTQVAAFLCFALVAVQFIYNNRDIVNVIERSNFLLRGLGLAVCLILIMLSSGQSDGFIYFQF
jgi:alginate O-acetyltransferase complex protein AlgI